MSDKFQVLDCNDDVLSFSNPEQTFKLGNFKERTRQKFVNKLKDYSQNEGFGFISISEMKIYSGNIKWESMPIDCEVLKMGANSWQKGKIRIQVTLERGSVNSHVGIQGVCLEFCPDEPPITQPESPLDDLRQMINQENQQ
jgi:hypothetical protein